MKSVIFNADDFGARRETNRAVIRAHREGALTSASLMVNEPAASEAVEMARDAPSLAVGLHVVLSDGRAALPAERIPRLAPYGGRFRASPALAGFVCFFSAAARRELRAEVEEQFARFAATGLPFSHVDGHQHLHVHPVAWDAVTARCEEHDVCRVRIPNEESFAAPPGAPAMRRIERIFFRALRRRCLRTLAGRRFTVADRVYGHLATGNVSAEYLVRLLPRLGGATNEIYLHPGTPHARPLIGGPSEADVELDALLSPVVKELIGSLQLRLATYASISERG